MDYPIRTVYGFDYTMFDHVNTVYKIGNNGGEHSKVIDMICAFDIETSRLPGTDDAFMYIWQFCVYKKCVVVGRTWEEFTFFIKEISRRIKKNKLCCYIHNASYEFGFLKGIFQMKPSEVFCMDKRLVLTFKILHNIEFRCSHLLTNRSLESWCNVCKPEHPKTKMEYNELRYPWTKLDPDELMYCVNDVISLCECLDIELNKHNDTLATIPKTSTGFVRREVKRTMRTVGQWYKKMLPSYPVYVHLRNGFRGGNTHASRFFAGTIMENVKSEDISSSYPAQMILSDHFPMSPFLKLAGLSEFKIRMKQNKCVIARVKIKGLKIKRDKIVSVPYISISNCEKCDTKVLRMDNGRLLAGDIQAYFTDIDLNIIERQYEYDSFEFISGYWAEPGYLPMQLRVLIDHYYKGKTELKGVEGEEAEKDYEIFKTYINSVYGMSVQDVCKDFIQFLQDADDQFSVDETRTKEALCDKYQKSGWFPYQWGVWVTAFARERLQEAIDLIDASEDAHFLYCDTDSVKYIGDVDFEVLNQKYRKQTKCGLGVATDANGKIHYIGLFESDGWYHRFLTLGAKKYFYTHIKDRKEITGITVAGVPKKRGAAWLNSIGGIDAVRIGLVFPAEATGKLTCVYNDHVNKFVEVVDNGEKHILHITDNILLRPVDYQLSITGDYEDLILTEQEIDDIVVALTDLGEYNISISG